MSRRGGTRSNSMTQVAFGPARRALQHLGLRVRAWAYHLNGPLARLADWKV
jgi:hypothetical protein